ncbi:MAG: hypothetical protein ACOZCO_10225 [Bacteroidota bacterium]
MKSFLILVFALLLFSCRKDKSFEHGPVDCEGIDQFTGQYSGTHFHYLYFPTQDTTHLDTCIVSNVSDSYTCKLYFSLLYSDYIVHSDNSIETYHAKIWFSGDSLFINKYETLNTGYTMLSVSFRGKRI